MEKVVRSSFYALVITFFMMSGSQVRAQDITVVQDGAVAKKILGNGLTVLSKYSPPSGLVAVDVKVMAGAGTEGKYTGSGISHLLEHMLFKGTVKRGPGDIEKEVKSYGGVINGSTSADFTGYYIILPANHLREALSILGDMLQNAKFDNDELSKEIDVILKEIRMNDDEPQSRLIRLLHETAYIAHPYKYPAIGYEDLLKALSASDLKEYYRERYVPNNITVTIVGSINTEDAIGFAEKEFCDMGRPDYGITNIGVREPIQISPRRRECRMGISLGYLAMGFHSTEVTNEDLFAMDVLSMILGRGDNSRLYSSLHKKLGLVHTISARNYTPREPGLFIISAVLDPEKSKEAESAVMSEIGRIQNGDVSEHEIASAIKVLQAGIVSAMESIEGQAENIATDYIFTGSEYFSNRYLNRTGAVTREEISAVARKYLNNDNLTTVTIMPENFKEPASAGVSAPDSESTIERIILNNGIRAFIRSDARIPMITVTEAASGGYAHETQSNNGISALAAEMMLRGTRARPESGKIKGAIEDMGGDISPFSGANTFGVSVTVLKNDIDTALQILRDITTNSSFSEKDMTRAAESQLAAIKNEDDDIFETGMKALKRLLFEGSPYALTPCGTARSVLSVKTGDVKSFHSARFRPGSTVITVSGDVAGTNVSDRIRELFSDINESEKPAVTAQYRIPVKPGSVKIKMDKLQSLLILGFRTAPRSSSDRYALEVLAEVMSGTSGRLFDVVRNEKGLAYTLGCWLDFWTDEGLFAFYVATSPDRLLDARATIMSEVARLRRTGVTDDEIIRAKKELTSRHRMSLQSNAFIALNFAVEELRGLGYDNIFKYEDAISGVTRVDIEKVVDKYIDPERSSEVIISSE